MRAIVKTHLDMNMFLCRLRRHLMRISAGLQIARLRQRQHEAAGHAQMAEPGERRAGLILHLGQQIFGAAVKAFDLRTAHALFEIFRKRKAQIGAMQGEISNAAALYMWGEAAAHGFNFGQFRHEPYHKRRLQRRKRQLATGARGKIAPLASSLAWISLRQWAIVAAQ